MTDVHRTRVQLGGGDGTDLLPDHVHAVVSRWCENEAEHDDLRKPYSVCAIERGRLGPAITIGTFTYSATESLLQSIADSSIVRFGRQRLTVEKAVVRDERSWEDLLDSAEPHRSATFRFLTPVVFRSGRHETILPSPGLVYGHLRAVWSTWCPPHLRPMLDLAALPIHVTSIAASTGCWQARRRRWNGYLGQVTFELSALHETERRKLDALGRLACFTGVGSNTTTGMGRTEYRGSDTSARSRAR